MNSLIVYTSLKSKKLEYVIEHICKNYLSLDYRITSEKEDFLNTISPYKINYSSQEITGVVNIKYSQYFEKFSKDIDPDYGHELMFNMASSNFDLFAAIFFTLARVEEYRATKPDEHGRFRLVDSLSYKRKLSRVPFIDIWVEQLRVHLGELSGVPIADKHEYEFLSTIDVDHIYAYRSKPLYLYMLSFLRDMLSFSWERIRDRFGAKDPYDSYDFIIEAHRSIGMNCTFFIMCCDRGEYDKIISHKNKDYQTVTRYLARSSDTGIHPSYASDSDPLKINNEKERLESVIDRPITISRQHYLRMRFPDTYRALIDANIQYDYSLAHHEEIGFRAGTSRAFKWYDLEDDKVTSLKIIPFQVMDMTLKKYMQLDVETAYKSVCEMVDQIKAVRGRFVLLWHNSSFYENEGWQDYKSLYLRILKYAKP